MKHTVEEQKKTTEQVMVLVELSMVNRDKLHIHIEYNPNVEWVGCDVIKADHNYLSGNWASELLLNEYIKLKGKDALKQLLDLEDKIVDLLGEIA